MNTIQSMNGMQAEKYTTSTTSARSSVGWAAGVRGLRGGEGRPGNGLTRSLAYEWARYGITVNRIAPGCIRTDFNRGALGDPGIVDRILSRIPLRRVRVAEEVGPPAVYLASDDSAFMTGQGPQRALAARLNRTTHRNEAYALLLPEDLPIQDRETTHRIVSLQALLLSA